MAEPLGRAPSTLLKILSSVLVSGVYFLLSLSAVRAQSQPAPPQAPPSPSTQREQKPETKASNDEIVSHDSPAAFKVRVNFVLVRVVVRDVKGKAVPNLKKEDFQLADNRKLQIISSFAMETPASHVPTVKVEAAKDATEVTPVKTPELPQRFVTLYFDDLHLSTSDLMQSRLAATKLLGAMGTGDRLAIFTTSGQVQLEFTADRDKLQEALERIFPHPLTSSPTMDCPPMSYYEAYQIIEANDPTALQIATIDAQRCVGNTPGAAQSLVQMAAQRELTTGDSAVQFAFQNLQALIRRMSALPGQRVIVMMSPGFFVTPSMRESSELIDRATKANIVINTIDARGLYVSSVYDVANRTPPDNLKTAFTMAEEAAQDDVLAELADGTGGVFFHNRNDIDKGLLQAAAEPEVSYVLGFTPQNLKLDGKYHHLKVTFTDKQKWTLQARHGYFAPKGSADPAAAAKEEIQQAVFSQDEMHELPIECQTQFFKNGNGVRLTVVAHIETQGLRFRKAEERNNDKLTVATVVFDENGNLLTGLEKILELRLKDATLERVNKTGISVKSSFDLQPGTFLVRIVVRDSEGTQMAAMNRGVVIPY
ncbi:MAG TPA: VWA domain-containing protein [Candidatus Acidoferrum sp.]